MTIVEWFRLRNNAHGNKLRHYFEFNFDCILKLPLPILMNCLKNKTFYNRQNTDFIRIIAHTSGLKRKCILKHTI